MISFSSFRMASLPDPVLNQLRCYKCKNFLSCRPISVTNKGESICGRCKPEQSVMLAHAYETVAEYFLFPCKNWEQHCAYLLNIKDVMEHEKNCSFGNCCSICCLNPGSLFKPDNKLDLTQSRYLICVLCTDLVVIYSGKWSHKLLALSCIKYDAHRMLVIVTLLNLTIYYSFAKLISFQLFLVPTLVKTQDRRVRKCVRI